MHNCITTLISLVEHWKLGRDKCQSDAVLSTDMFKAFDSLHPPLMLSKLHVYGFEENTLNLLRSYLTDRQSRVKLSPVTSNWQTVNRAFTIQGLEYGTNFHLKQEISHP